MGDRDFIPEGHPLIWMNPHRYAGRPCLKGTRIPPDAVALMRQQGYRTHEILTTYDGLTPALIEAAVRWMADPERKRLERNIRRRRAYVEAKG